MVLFDLQGVARAALDHHRASRLFFKKLIMAIPLLYIRMVGTVDQQPECKAKDNLSTV